MSELYIIPYIVIAEIQLLILFFKEKRRILKFLLSLSIAGGIAGIVEVFL
jgi:presenilin-like A22 family membrane protease